MLVFMMPLAGFAAECKDFSWKLVERNGHWATYRGHVKSGTRRVYLELYNNGGMIAQDRAYPNPNGNWEMLVRADYHVKKSHREKFFCD